MPTWVRHTTKPSVTSFVTGLTLKLYAEGTLVADGSEQTLTSINSLLKLSGYVDLSKMDEDDETVIRQYVRVKRSGKLTKYGEETYCGFQAQPAVYITPKVLGHGGVVVLQQTKGTFKTFDYEFIIEE